MLSFDFDKAYIDPKAENNWFPGFEDCKALFTFLGEYLQPDSTISAETALNRTVQYFSDVSKDALFAFCGIVLNLAQQIPYDDSAHLKLVDHAQSFADWHQKENPHIEHSMVWQKFKQCIVDGSLSPDDLAEEGDDPMDYVNTTAFCATILKSRAPFRYDSGIAWELDQALSGDATSQAAEVRNAWVLGVTRWLVLSADRLFEFVLEAQTPPRQPVDDAKEENRGCFGRFRRKRAPRSNDEYHFLNLEKWHSWRKGFESVAVEDRLSPQAKAAAEEAAERMAALEKLADMPHSQTASS